jgi:predicted DCC family thiol-disulfide oxidoreductase YuxK
MANSSPQGLSQCLLIYDGRGLERMADGQALRMIPYQSEEAKRVLGVRHQGERPEAAFLVNADGGIASGLDAFLPLLPGLRGGRLLAKLFALQFVKPLGYWLYGLVAKYRYQAFGEVPLDPHD